MNLDINDIIARYGAEVARLTQQVVLRKHETEITELRERIALLEAQIGTP